jgi:hypothetical protein
MLQQLTCHGKFLWSQKTIPVHPATNIQDLDPRPCTDNALASVLPFEMAVVEPGENLTRTLTWKPWTFLRYVRCRTGDDRFPLSLWGVWFSSSFGVPIPALIGPPQQCVCNSFHYDLYGDHLSGRHVKLNQRIHRFMSECNTSWVPFLVRWVTQLRSK